MKKQKLKIYAFIDSQNLNLSIRSQGWVLNFGRFRKYLEDKYKVNKVFLFIGYVSGNESLYTSFEIYLQSREKSSQPIVSSALPKASTKWRTNTCL